MTNTKHYIYGVHAIEAALNHTKHTIHLLYVNQDRQDQRLLHVCQQAQDAQIPINYLTASAMKQRFASLIHQGVVAEISAPQIYSDTELPHLLQNIKHKALILILDGVTDPHNLGACLRSADAAGVDLVIIPKDNSASITPVVNKVASGAVESVPLVRVTNLARTLSFLKQEGVWLYGATEEGQNTVYEIEAQNPIAIILGSEDKGLRRLTKDHCDYLFKIPMLGQVPSLNVSVAAGICLYEVVRQRTT